MKIAVPMVSICPSYIVAYNTYEGYNSSIYNKEHGIKPPVNNNPAGSVSQKAERRIKKAIDWLLLIAKDKTFYHNKFKREYDFKINFVTLTLSSRQMHDDNIIKKECLNHFLTVARQKWKVKNYLWRAEAQRNGNIHFHIVTDTFIPWAELRDTWNNIQNKLGYVDKFREKYNHKRPNSTDVHSIKKIRNISAYLAKYCSKNSANRPILGKLWGLSTGLSNCKSVREVVTNAIGDGIRQVNQLFKTRKKSFDYCTIWYVKVDEWRKQVGGELLKLFDDYVSHLKTELG